MDPDIVEQDWIVSEGCVDVLLVHRTRRRLAAEMADVEVPLGLRLAGTVCVQRAGGTVVDPRVPSSSQLNQVPQGVGPPAQSRLVPARGS